MNSIFGFQTISICSNAFRNYANQISIRFANSQRLFTEKHEWISIEDDSKQIGRVGISNHAQEALGDVVFVQVPEIGAHFKQYDEVGAIESVKAASELMTPVSGQITSVNEDLAQKPALVNSSCYDEGWLFKIKLSQPKELESLMDEDGYKEFLEKTSPEADRGS